MPAGIVTRVGKSQSPFPSPSLCDLAAKRVGLDEVGERALSLDLDDGKPLAVASLQVGISTDVYLGELEPELRPRGLDDTARRGAEVAAFGVVEDDPGYG